ncbi:MAG TPA: diguanylate cyclase [Gaiellaceae bacterium]
MSTLAPAPPSKGMEAARLAAACRCAVAAVASSEDPSAAAEAAVTALHATLDGVFVSAFVLEHDRLWIVAQRGYTMVPDGVSVEDGVMGRAVRQRRAQVVRSVAADPDYVPAMRGVTGEIAVPLRLDDEVVGVLNIESVSTPPAEAARLLRPLARALVPVVEQLRSGRALDLSALARLFVYVSSLRDPRAIAELAAGSLARVLPVETTQISLFTEEGALEQLAVWRSGEAGPSPLADAEIERIRASVDPAAVFELLALERSERWLEPRSAVWLPLRAGAVEFGVLVGTSRWTREYDRGQAEVAALLAAHAAASLDAALALGRERQSALTDPLTGLLNRRGFEQRLDAELATAQRDREPLSLLVLDCDDFKVVNDRAGHEFGDALLRETARALDALLPEGASCARVGGDEFVILLPRTDGGAGEAAGNGLRVGLTAELADAGFPLRVSAGVATYPFDGGQGSQLLRAADQALYAAKDQGKDRVVGFRDAMGGQPASRSPARTRDRRRTPSHAELPVVSDMAEAAQALWAEATVDGVLQRLCKTLTFVVGGTGCLASRVDGDVVYDVARHSLRDVHLGHQAAYLIDDFPLTAEVLRTGESRGVSFLDGEVDRAEAFVLRELGMSCVLLLPLLVHGDPWGLVELYDVRLRHFRDVDRSIAEFLVGQAARRLETLGDEGAPGDQAPPVVRVPSGARPRRRALADRG